VVFKNLFPEYKGTNDPVNCREHIKDKFLHLVAEGNSINLQIHHTCALDTKAMDTVFEAVKATIMIKRLQGMGMVL